MIKKSSSGLPRGNLKLSNRSVGGTTLRVDLPKPDVDALRVVSRFIIDMATKKKLASAVAEVILSGSREYEEVESRLERAVGGKGRWLTGFLDDLDMESFQPGVPLYEAVRMVIENDQFQKAMAQGKVMLHSEALREMRAQMTPAQGAPSEWKVPPIESVDGLCRFLGIEYDDLYWLGAPCEVKYHYGVQWISKGRGRAPRMIEAPKPVLQGVQRRLLDALLSKIPAHDAAHGFVAGRSVHSYVEPHVGKALVLKLDVANFFHQFAGSRVRRIFLAAGYPPVVAEWLVKLVTTGTPARVLDEGRPMLMGEARRRLKARHLPQGGVTSPTLSNLGAYRLDRRLAGLAEVLEARYTRYADDLVFSWEEEFGRQKRERIVSTMRGILREEGFEMAEEKTRWMGRGEQQKVGGIVVNERPNLDRREFDRLRAILTNCKQCGIESQNREGHPDFKAHIDGRVSWAVSVNPEKGKRLVEILDEVARD